MSDTGRVWTVLSMINWATNYFSEKNVPDPRLSIEWILASALNVKRLDLYLQHDRPLSSRELNSIRPMVKRRASFEPLQYITGSTQFLDTIIQLTPDVLIPRIETEQLIDLLLEQTKPLESKPVRLLDLGTGSGCIPIAIKKRRPHWICSGTDISQQALELAQKNADLNETDVTFFAADIENLSELSGQPQDIIVSNPPYISEDEKKEMHEQVLNYEPHLALFHESPVKLYQKIIEFASNLNAQLYLECNDKTANDVAEIAGKYFDWLELFKDLDGNDRFVVASKALSNDIP